MRNFKILKYAGSVSFLTLALAAQPVHLAQATTEAGFYEALERFHGHTCAGSLIGARLGLAAKAALKAAGGEGKLQAKYFDHSCPVDGVQFAAGTTYGNRALEVHERKEQRLLLTAEKNGKTVESALTKGAQENGIKYRELSTKLRRFASDSPQRKQLQKEVDSILHWFKTAPEEDVVLKRIVK